MENQNIYLVAKNQFGNYFVGSLADLEKQEQDCPDENWTILESDLTREDAWFRWEELKHGSSKDITTLVHSQHWEGLGKILKEVRHEARTLFPACNRKSYVARLQWLAGQPAIQEIAKNTNAQLGWWSDWAARNDVQSYQIIDAWLKDKWTPRSPF